MSAVYSFLNVTYHHFSTMSRLFREGWTANRVQTFMSELGMGYRRSTVQAVRRQVLDLVKKEGLIKSLSGEKRPTKGYISELSWERPYKYKVFGSVDVIDLETGETKPQSISFYSNDLKSKNEYLADMSTQLDAERYGVSIAFGQLTLRQIQHREDLSY